MYKKDGAEIFVLIHIEIQGQQEAQFSERMYVYQYLLFHRHHVPIVSIAVLIDGNKSWRPSVYQTSLWGTKLTFEYNMIKLLDFQVQCESLEQSNNSFAIVILAQLAAMELAKKQGAANKLATKLALTKLLFSKGWAPIRVNHLLKFIDWLILLPSKLVIEYDAAIHDFNEEPYMTYVTQYQRFLINRDKGHWLHEGELKGELKGKLAGQRETQRAIAKQLLVKGQTTAFVADITGLSAIEIESLHKETQH